MNYLPATPHSEGWHNLDTPFQDLKESRCHSPKIGRICVPLHICLYLFLIPPLYVLYDVLYLIISIFEKSGCFSPQSIGRIWVAPPRIGRILLPLPLTNSEIWVPHPQKPPPPSNIF